MESLGELVIKLRVDADGVDSALGVAESKMQQTGSSADNMAQGVFLGQMAFEALNVVGSAVIGVMGSVADGMGEIMVAGSNFARIETTTKRMAENMGVSNDEVDRMVKGLAETNTYGSKAYAVISSFTQTGLLDMAKGLERVNTETGKTTQGFDAFVLTAKDFGAKAGVSSGDAIDMITKSIIRMSPEMLDQLGIQINLNKAYEEEAIRLGRVDKAGKGMASTLSVAERQQAMLNAIMAEGVKVAGVYESANATSAKRLLSIGDALFSVKESVGASFEPVMFAVSDTVYKLVDAVRNVGVGFSEGMKPQMELAKVGLEKLGTTINKLLSALGLANINFNAVGVTLGDMVGGALNKVIEYFDYFVQGVTQYAPVIKEAFLNLGRALGIVDSKAGDVSISGEEVAKSFGKISAVMIIDLFAALTGLVTFLQRNQGNIDTFANTLKTIADTITAITSALDRFTGMSGAKDMLGDLGAVASTALSNVGKPATTSSSGSSANFSSGKLYNMFADGTDFAPGGSAIVGENGPELVNLPRGSQVVPNSEMGVGKNITIVNNVDGNIDLDAFSNRLTFQLRYL